MSITYTIPGATPLDQLHDATSDGQADENARENCVPTSIAEGLHILTGGSFNGDELKDAVYGQGYTGTMAAAHFVAYCQQHGVSLSEYSDTQAGLIAAIHREVASGHPVLVTMPSQWGTAPADPVHPSGYTHVGCAVGLGAGEIRVMNPWGGFYQDESDEWWQARLCYGAVWVMSATASATTQKGTNTMAIVRNADGSATDSGNGLHVGSGIAEYIFAHHLEGASLLTGEVAYTNGGQQQAAVALSTGAVVRWYGSGADENAAAVMCGLMGELANAQAATKTLQDANSALNTTRASLQSQLSDAKGQIETLQQQLAAAKATPAPTVAPASVPTLPATPATPAPSGGDVSGSTDGTQSTQGVITPVNIFQKAWANLTMTPWERALLRLLEGWLWAGLIAAFGVVWPLISSGHLSFNATTISAVASAAFVAIMSAVKKYIAAHGDLINSLGNGGGSQS